MPIGAKSKAEYGTHCIGKSGCLRHRVEGGDLTGSEGIPVLIGTWRLAETVVTLF